MFIKYPLDDGRNLLIEEIKQPIVYLDNWAINDIALDLCFRQRFIDIMKNREGTLRLSVSNMVELLKQTDHDQIESILSLIDLVDAGFINTNFQEVIALENRMISGEVDENPSNQLDLIYAYLLSQNWPESWIISDVVRTVLKNSSGKHFSESWDQFAEKMKNFIDAVRSDHKYINKSKIRSALTRKKGKKHDRATRELFELGFNFVLQNPDMRMSSNEWHDFFHSIVPVAYCDIVLLDRRWTAFVAQTKFNFPDIAFAFSRKSINEFFYKLETFIFSVDDSSAVL